MGVYFNKWELGAAADPENIQAWLDEGFEPFAVVPSETQGLPATIYFRRMGRDQVRVSD